VPPDPIREMDRIKATLRRKMKTLFKKGTSMTENEGALGSKKANADPEKSVRKGRWREGEPGAWAVEVHQEPYSLMSKFLGGVAKFLGSIT